MSKNFSLLKQLSEIIQRKNKMPLSELKTIANQYISAHNSIMEEIWALNVRLAESDLEGKERISSELEQLKSDLARYSSEQDISSLLEKIKAMEMELHGSSVVGGNSPTTF
jgi:hypothetical protein